MANYAVQELASILQSLPTLKPPGVNKTKVDAATKLCMDPSNTPIEGALVDTLVNSFRNSPSSHKLGVLYIVDSITRQWVATGSIHATGVRKITDALPYMINDFLPSVPDSQKDKLVKLFDIWLSSKTFPAPMLTDFKNRLYTLAQAPTPQIPQHIQNNQEQAPNNTIPANLLAALTGASPVPPIAQQQHQQQHQQQQQPPPPPPPPPPPQQQHAPTNHANLLAALLGHQAQSQPQPNANSPSLPFSQNNGQVTYPPPGQVALPNQNAVPNNFTGMNANSFTPPNANPFAALMPQTPNPPPANNPPLNQMQLLQQLAQNPEALKTVLAALGVGGPAQTPNTPAQIPQLPNAPPNSYNVTQQYGREENGNSRNRSRSPDFKRRRNSPPNRRESPTYGTYDPHSSNDNDDYDRSRRGRRNGRDSRARSPPQQQQHNLFNDSNLPPTRKIVDYDPSLKDNQIRVLSRTLFVGGVKTTEGELKNFFRTYGGVQSCIVNHEKRHAFLKLITHEDAEKVRSIVSMIPDKLYRTLFERVNWAVGFGPTSCADYANGESIIPIDLLTDADRKWIITAEYGGTGGKPLEGRMIVEEPDIEIGAGPSSKAIHRRGGGQQGRGNSFAGGRRGNNDQGNKRKADHRPESFESQVIAAPPAVPTFGAPIPGFPNIR